MTCKCNKSKGQSCNCGSIGSFFGEKIDKSCQVLRLDDCSDISIRWSCGVAHIDIDPCNLIRKDIVRGLEDGCISVVKTQDLQTGECYYGLSQTSRYFVNGVAFKRGYGGDECFWNLPVVSTDNTVTIDPVDLGGGDIALNLRVAKRPQSMIFEDGNGGECQVDTDGPIRFKIDSPCWNLECSEDNTGVTFIDSSDFGINGVKFNCSQIYFTDPDGDITFTPDPDNDNQIIVSYTGCKGFSSVKAGEDIYEADCNEIEFDAEDGLDVTVDPDTGVVTYGIGMIPSTKVCISSDMFVAWAGPTFGAPGGPSVVDEDTILKTGNFTLLSTVTANTGYDFTPFNVGPYDTDVYVVVDAEIDGRLFGGASLTASADVGVVLAVFFNGNWVVVAPVSTTTPTGDSGGSGPYSLECDLPDGCTRGINVSHKAVVRLAAGGTTTVDLGIAARGRDFGLQSRKVVMQIIPICS